MALWQFAGFVLTTLGGTLLHFLYGWTGDSLLVAPFAAVNESTWEHMKLLYVPMLLFALVQRRFFKDRQDFWCVKFWGILTGLLLVPLLFYTYNGAVGPSPAWLNIVIFFVAAAVAFWLEWVLFKKEVLACKYPLLPLAGILLMGALFVLFTFAPPPLPLFSDPSR